MRSREQGVIRGRDGGGGGGTRLTGGIGNGFVTFATGDVCPERSRSKESGGALVAVRFVCSQHDGTKSLRRAKKRSYHDNAVQVGTDDGTRSHMTGLVTGPRNIQKF